MTAQTGSFVLMIGDDAALLLPPRGFKKATPVFAASHEADQKIFETLALAPRTPILLLADVLAQAFTRETLPPLSFFDQKKLLRRRLEQTYPKATLRTALVRKDGAVLMAKLEDDGPVKLWLDRLAKRPNPSGQVCLLPLESAALIGKLTPAAQEGWGLFLAHHKTGGFRQIVTCKGEVLFTRLTPPHQSLTHVDTIAESLAQDIEATRAYLSRMGLTDETPLHLAAILPPALHKAFSDRPLPVASHLLFSPREAAARLGLVMPPQPDEPSGDLVSALWLQTRPKPQTDLMRPESRKARHTARLLKTGTTLAVTCGLLAFLTLTIEGASLWQRTSANETKRLEVRTLEETQEKARHTLAKEAAPLDRLRKAVERRRLFTKPNESPDELLRLVQNAIGPGVRAVGLVWEKEALNIDLLLKDEEMKTNFSELQRQKMTRDFDNLAFLLRGTLEEYEVKITRYPFPTLPNETITNKDQRGQKTLPVATFLIRKEAP